MKVVYETIEQFLANIHAYMDFDLDKEKQLQMEAKSELVKMKREFETIKKSKPRNDMEKDKRQ